jgi:ferric-dicitrate binding protein FerR (iron transport regulator)
MSASNKAKAVRPTERSGGLGSVGAADGIGSLALLLAWLPPSERRGQSIATPTVEARRIP